MDGIDHLQRENSHVPCLNLLSQLRVNEIRLLICGSVSLIADGRLFLLLVYSSWKGDQDAMLRYMAE